MRKEQRREGGCLKKKMHEKITHMQVSCPFASYAEANATFQDALDSS